MMLFSRLRSIPFALMKLVPVLRVGTRVRGAPRHPAFFRSFVWIKTPLPLCPL